MDSPTPPSNSQATVSAPQHSSANRYANAASHLLVATLLLLVLVYGMLAGLLAICIGFMLANTLAGRSVGNIGPQKRRSWGGTLSPGMAAGVVIVLPILGILALMLNARGMAFGAIAQYQQLLHHLANTVLQIREKLPPDLASYLPIGITEAQAWLVEYLQSQARSLTHLGSVGLRGGLLVYVGLIVGALMVGTPPPASQGPLRDALRQRGADFMLSFKQIVVAQFWIAAFNAACTALFLLVALPLADVSIPYTGALIMLTFAAGLIPIVGNLLCNGVLTLAGVSVAPMVGVACLLFLIAIHKFEYFINAKIVGKRTSTSAWELLTIMFIGEAVFGLSGLVAAPLLYAYTKRELRCSGLI